MVENPKDRQPLLDEKELDARYRDNPFPSFTDWDAEEPRDEARQARALSQEIDAEVAAAGGEGQERLRHALDVTLRAAAVDTGAIEGLYETDEGITMTIAKRASGWQAVAEANEILPFFEAQLSALEIVMDLVTEGRPLASEVTEVAIKGLHAEITKNQTTYEVQTPAGRQLHELPRGVYKKQPNHVMTGEGEPYPYAPVLDTPKEMERLVGELTSEAFLEAAPIVQAAYCHYSLVRIHPFADGNGRVARALASIYLLRSYRVPLVIFSEERSEYLEALRAADRSSKVSFNEFVGRSVIGAMELALDEIRYGEVPAVDEEGERLSQFLDSSGIDHRYADRAAKILMETFEEELLGATDDAIRKFPDLSSNALKDRSGQVTEGYRKTFDSTIDDTFTLHLTASGPEPEGDSAVAGFRFVVLVSEPSSTDEPILVRLGGSIPALEVDARRVVEGDSRVRRRLRRWAQRTVAKALEDLRTKLESSGEEKGN